MAKRKRLSPANPAGVAADLQESPDMLRPSPLPRAPIADVASEASSRAALDEVTAAMAQARDKGRMVLELELSDIDPGYLVRDRIAVNDEEMDGLKASLSARGQQTPVEVVDLGAGRDGPRYGLISGWRRCKALEAIGQGQVLALLRNPSEMSDAYLAMVEENEIRSDLSYFERARIVAKAVEQGVFPHERVALQELFASASRAKRSKIGSFLPLVKALDGGLQHPQAITERLGLTLSRRLGETPGLAAALQKRLSRRETRDAEDELNILNGFLGAVSETKKTISPPQFEEVELRIGLTMRRFPGQDRIELHGPALTNALKDDLEVWLKRGI